MKYRGYNAQRDANEKPIVEALKKAGCSVVRLNWVDLMVGYDGKTFLIEVKTEDGKLNAKQTLTFASWRGSKIHIIRTVDEALEVIYGKR